MNEANANLHFYPSLIKSLLLHLLIFALFQVKLFLFPQTSIDLQSAIRVDVVAMPDKISPPTPPANKNLSPPAPAPKKSIAKKPSLSLSKEKKLNREEAMQQAIDRARALQQIEDELRAEEERVQAQEYKGNIISKGSDLDGVHRLQYDDYLGQVEAHIKSFWQIPAWMADTDLRAEAEVRISAEGYIISKRITQSSGDKNYDQLVLATVDKAAPFPPPSEKFRSILANEGFRLGFPK